MKTKIDFNQIAGESLWDTFVRRGMDPEKFGVSKPRKTRKKRATITTKNVTVVRKKKGTVPFLKKASEGNIDASAMIKYLCKNIDKLSNTHSKTTIKLFLLSVVSYLNDGEYSRRNLYDFVKNYDMNDNIRMFTFETYNYEVKFEDWHHVGGAFSYMVGKFFTGTDKSVNNGVDTKNCKVYMTPRPLLKYVESVNAAFKTSGEITLDDTFNTTL